MNALIDMHIYLLLALLMISIACGVSAGSQMIEGKESYPAIRSLLFFAAALLLAPPAIAFDGAVLRLVAASATLGNELLAMWLAFVTTVSTGFFAGLAARLIDHVWRKPATPPGKTD